MVVVVEMENKRAEWNLRSCELQAFPFPITASAAAENEVTYLCVLFSKWWR